MRYRKPIIFALLCTMLFSLSTDFSIASENYNIANQLANSQAENESDLQKDVLSPAEQKTNTENEEEKENPDNKEQEYIDALVKVYFDDSFNHNKKRPDITQNFILYADGEEINKEYKINLVDSLKDNDKNLEMEEYKIKKLPLYNDKDEIINYEIEQKSLAGYAPFEDKDKYAQDGEKIKIIEDESKTLPDSEDSVSDEEDIKYIAEKIFGNIEKKTDNNDTDNSNAEEPSSDSAVTSPDVDVENVFEDSPFSNKMKSFQEIFNNPFMNIRASLFDFSPFNINDLNATISVTGYGISSSKTFEYTVTVSAQYISGDSIEIDNGDGTTKAGITNSSIEIKEQPYSGEYTIENEDGTTATAEAVDGKVVLKSGQKVVLNNLPTSPQAISIIDSTDKTGLIPMSDDVRSGTFENDNLDFLFKYNTTNSSKLTFTKQWNDNNSTGRPDSQDVTMSLCYIDESGTRQAFTADNISEFCLTTIPSVTYNGASGANWTYVTSDSNLPIYDENGKKINYSLLEEPVSGYVSTYPDTGNISIVNTSLTEINFTKQWNDGNNQFDTRVTDSAMLEAMTLYEGKGDDKTKSKTILQSDDSDAPGYIYVGDISGDNKKKITIKNLPQFDSDGIPIEYSISENEMQVSAENNLTNPGNVKYNPSYVNVGESVAEKTSVYDNGTLSNTLSERIDFNANKKWLDYQVNPNDRPVGTVYLYRYPDIPNRNYN